MTNPDDDTQAHRSPAEPGTGSSEPAAQPSEAPSSPSPTSPPLTVDPNRPADPGWREPAWIPARPRPRRPSVVSLIVGVGLILAGLWFFADRTLGIDLPGIEWNAVWPVILIVIGGAVLIRSLERPR